MRSKGVGIWDVEGPAWVYKIVKFVPRLALFLSQLKHPLALSLRPSHSPSTCPPSTLPLLPAVRKQDENGTVVMNPGCKYIINDNSVFFCIADNEDQLDEIRREAGREWLRAYDENRSVVCVYECLCVCVCVCERACVRASKRATLVNRGQGTQSSRLDRGGSSGTRCHALSSPCMCVQVCVWVRVIVSHQAACVGVCERG